MNRNEEYILLLSELEKSPPALEYTVARVAERAKKSLKTRRIFAIPIGSLAAVFLCFTALVNLSSGFALACGNIPFLRELAAAVAFSPSLTAAVENDYVQLIEQEQTENGITMRVEYVIVDQKQLNIFYSLSSELYSQMDTYPQIKTADGEEIHSYMLNTSHTPDIENGAIRKMTVNFVDLDMPGGLLLICDVFNNNSLSDDEDAPPIPVEDMRQSMVYAEPETISSFSFLLEFDPYYTQTGEVIDLNHGFDLHGQRLTIGTIEIFPTHMRLNLLDDENNTSWLQGLSFYIENEQGERFDTINNGVLSTGSPNSPFVGSYHLESAYFSRSESLTLHITEAVWVNKNHSRTEIDIYEALAYELPEGVTLDSLEKKDGDVHLLFTAENAADNSFYQIFAHQYYDEYGNEYEFTSQVYSSADTPDGENAELNGASPRFKTEFILRYYPYRTVYLSPAFSFRSSLGLPIEIKLK